MRDKVKLIEETPYGTHALEFCKTLVCSSEHSLIEKVNHVSLVLTSLMDGVLHVYDVFVQQLVLEHV